jgi:hypothetical protein
MKIFGIFYEQDLVCVIRGNYTLDEIINGLYNCTDNPLLDVEELDSYSSVKEATNRKRLDKLR